MLRNNLLVDCLHNLDPHSGSSPEYNRGILVGVVSVFMAQGMSFRAAIHMVKENMPINYKTESIPEPWRADFAR